MPLGQEFEVIVACINENLAEIPNIPEVALAVSELIYPEISLSRGACENYGADEAGWCV